MSESGFISFTNAEWAELDAHADDLAEQIDALKPLAEAAVAYLQVLYGLGQRGALDADALADLERVDKKYGAVLDAYINGDNDEGETSCMCL